MKRLLFIPLIFICSTLWAADSCKEPIQLARTNPYIAGAGVAAAACTTPDNGDVLDEGFEGGYEVAGWTETIGAGGSATENYTLTGTPPTGSCTKGVNIVASGANTYIYWDNGSTIDTGTVDVDVTFHLRINSVTYTNFESSEIFSLGQSSTLGSTTTMELRLYNNNGTYQVKADAVADTSYITISTGTWYTIKIHVDASDAATSYLQILEIAACDTAGECTFTADTIIDPRYFAFGSVLIGAGESIDMEIGYVSINTP